MAHSSNASHLASANYITACAAFSSTQDCAKELAPDEISFAGDQSGRKLTCVWFLTRPIGNLGDAHFFREIPDFAV